MLSCDLGFSARKAGYIFSVLAYWSLFFGSRQAMGLVAGEKVSGAKKVHYRHPQGPTADRAIAELLEELVMLGGGYGLWAGCAAGDTGAAMVFKVS